MSEVVGYKNKAGTCMAYTTVLEKQATKMNLTPIFKGDPDEYTFRPVIEAEVEKAPRKSTRRSIVN